MKKINIYILGPNKDKPLLKTNFSLTTKKHSVEIRISTINLLNSQILEELKKLDDVIKIYDMVKRINIIFDTKLESMLINKLITKLNDILYVYYPTMKEVKIYQTKSDAINLMTELIKYKDIVMDPNKNPESYLEYIVSSVPDTYQTKIFNLVNKRLKKIDDIDLFPLTRAVGVGSSYPSYFVHIYPKQSNPKNKNIYLIGKAVTFDSGGLNIKVASMEEMKVDMTGSAIILSVLRLLSINNQDSKLNIHLIIPIVENMIGNSAVRPGMVIKSMSGRLIEITNTDAEGRLCLVDGIDYVKLFLIKDMDISRCLILDIATLTGNTMHITSGISSLAMCNNVGSLYLNNLMSLGEDLGEYVDFLKIRNEYLDILKSKVGDIQNLNLKNKSGCIVAGTFLHYFVGDLIPWIHIDVGVSTFVDSVANSYGINLLYEFIKSL